MDFVQKLAMTNWVAVPGRSSKSLPKVKLATKKVIVPVWWSAAGMKHYNFLKWSESCSVVSDSLWLGQSIEFSRPEYWSREPFPSPGHLPNPGIKDKSLLLQEDSLPAKPQGKPTTFWILEKSLHLRSMLSKSMRYTEIFNSYSQHWSTERAQFCTITPGHISHNQYFKSWMNWATKFCLIHHNHLSSH